VWIWLVFERFREGNGVAEARVGWLQRLRWRCVNRDVPVYMGWAGEFTGSFGLFCRYMMDIYNQGARVDGLALEWDKVLLKSRRALELGSSSAQGVYWCFGSLGSGRCMGRK